jgi:hypothetical protein
MFVAHWICGMIASVAFALALATNEKARRQPKEIRLMDKEIAGRRASRAVSRLTRRVRERTTGRRNLTSRGEESRAPCSAGVPPAFFRR